MTIITQIVEFILFKRDVKDIDYNPTLTVGIFIVYTGLMVLSAHAVNTLPATEGVEPLFTHVPYMFMVVIALSFTGFYYALFAAQEKQSRFVQTLTAYYGSSVLLSIIGGVANLIPAGILIVIMAQAFSLVCAVRATMQALDYSAFRAFFAIIGVTMLAVVIGYYTFTPTVNPVVLEQQTIEQVSE